MDQDPGYEPFEDLVAEIDYPVFVVTTRGRAAAGCLVGFASQTSIHPPRFLVGLSRKNRTFAVAQDATHLAVHLLSRDDVELAELFGGQTGDEIDKFSRCDWHEGPAGLPILDRAPAWFVGEILDRLDVGDHVGHLLKPVDGHAPPGFANRWVRFSDVRDLAPGHEA